MTPDEIADSGDLVSLSGVAEGIAASCARRHTSIKSDRGPRVYPIDVPRLWPTYVPEPNARPLATLTPFVPPATSPMEAMLEKLSLSRSL